MLRMFFYCYHWDAATAVLWICEYLVTAQAVLKLASCGFQPVFSILIVLSNLYPSMVHMLHVYFCEECFRNRQQNQNHQQASSDSKLWSTCVTTFHWRHAHATTSQTKVRYKYSCCSSDLAFLIAFKQDKLVWRVGMEWNGVRMLEAEHTVLSCAWAGGEAGIPQVPNHHYPGGTGSGRRTGGLISPWRGKHPSPTRPCGGSPLT